MGHSTTERRLAALVTELADAHREVAAAQARESRLLAGAAELITSRVQELLRAGRTSGSDLMFRQVSAEIALALNLSDRTVQRRIGDAVTVTDRYAETAAAWERGEIDARHVQVVVEGGVGIRGDSERARYELLVLAAAREQTAGRLRAIARTIAARIDPEAITAQIEQSQADRIVRVLDLDDGLARLIADLPATLAHAIYDRLTGLARTVRDGDRGTSVDPEAASADEHDDEPDVTTTPRRETSESADADTPADSRTMDQLRADVLADLLLAGGPMAHGDALDSVVAHVQVSVPVLTVAGVGGHPAVLTGHGPIDPTTARRLAGGVAGWDRVMSDPYTGEVLAVDRYRPGADLVRRLRVRDEHCRFPGCTVPARRADLDHTIDAALGGPTRLSNLAHLCRRHHTLKHETEWSVTQRAGGVIEWRSPLGRRRRDRPPATVAFVPDPAATI